MPSRSLTIEQVLTLLAETPPRIAALTAGLAPAQLYTPPNHDGWSVNDVLAHLRACADVWGNCIVAMIAEDTPTLRAVNPRTWIKKTDYLELEFRPSLRSFATQRADQQSARHAGTGPAGIVHHRRAVLQVSQLHAGVSGVSCDLVRDRCASDGRSRILDSTRRLGSALIALI